MQDINKLIDAAVELRIADLKAREQGIIDIQSAGTEREVFQFYDEKDFAQMIKGRDYTIEKFNRDFRYRYTSFISGLTFTCITNELLFEDDKNKIEEAWRCSEV